MQEAVAAMVPEQIQEERLVTFLSLADLRRLFLVHAPDLDQVASVLLFLDVRLDVFPRQALGVLLAPVIERRADGLGRLETGNVMAAETAEAVDGPLADVPFQVVVVHL